MNNYIELTKSGIQIPVGKDFSHNFELYGTA